MTVYNLTYKRIHEGKELTHHEASEYLSLPLAHFATVTSRPSTTFAVVFLSDQAEAYDATRHVPYKIFQKEKADG